MGEEVKVITELPGMTMDAIDPELRGSTLCIDAGGPREYHARRIYPRWIGFDAEALSKPLAFFLSGVEIARVTPSLPQWQAAQGGRPPYPQERLNFSFTLPKIRSTAMLHGASPDEAVSARGPIAIRYCPLF